MISHTGYPRKRGISWVLARWPCLFQYLPCYPKRYVLTSSMDRAKLIGWFQSVFHVHTSSCLVICMPGMSKEAIEEALWGERADHAYCSLSTLLFPPWIWRPRSEWVEGTWIEMMGKHHPTGQSSHFYSNLSPPGVPVHLWLLGH